VTARQTIGDAAPGKIKKGGATAAL
jgi:hypothetical protein